MKRWLLALGLLLGVLVMHGVAANHDMPMASAAAVSSPDGDADMAGHHEGMASIEAAAVVVSAPVTGHPMAAMCVAILTSGLLLPLLSVFRFKRRTADRRLPSPAAWSMVPRAAAARWLTAPSLTRLCVSRT